MNDLSPSRRGTGEDVLLTVLLWFLDTVVGIVVLLTGLGTTGFNAFEPDRHASLTPVFAYVAGFAGVVLLSAIGLYRRGYRVSVTAQVIAGVAALALCAAGLSGHLTL
ncbi:DUF6234 family protein [Streptomyces sp. LP11]|uniref:DUF6234 family protein n=1 Tax=Streptomyces pyxinicus TaxID=2970331 RepID=A0ABT2B1M2_9ACTN|nr:DUF6234 family protein [Streptomyces sp. LP11]MCS0602381.1 DUF6234 family protein [Streptomyces sp. LP11]